MTATASPVNLPMTLSKRGLSSSVCRDPDPGEEETAPANRRRVTPPPRDERLVVRTAATRPCRRLSGPTATHRRVPVCGSPRENSPLTAI